ncbi:uncharacterized protein ARMOST_18974 [Armillaria ostoyae]|uniref:Uncharacterized protein n=1 Tax=Armillaria ostoyae TaxID=47428 RepID=A0A284S3B3_ARMOS|nr:uncharacterized protein ARMOST_18974 [Armillaria ostoyae]
METPPPDLSEYDKSVIFDQLDLTLNRMILESLLHGLYTGIVAVTLWTIFSSTKRLHGTFLRTIIIVLYVLATISFVIDWVFGHRAFITYGDNYYTVFSALMDDGPWWRACFLIDAITGGGSTLLVDVTIIWRCWVLWDRQWRIVFLPIICTIAGTAMKIMETLSVVYSSTDDISKIGVFAPQIDWSLIYIVLTLTTTVLCTVLILYRIGRFAHRLLLFRSIISALIESSAIYTLALVVYLALVRGNTMSAAYADIVATYVRAIAPTLLVLRVAARSTPQGSHCRTDTSESV